MDKLHIGEVPLSVRVLSGVCAAVALAGCASYDGALPAEGRCVDSETSFTLAEGDMVGLGHVQARSGYRNDQAVRFTNNDIAGTLSVEISSDKPVTINGTKIKGEGSTDGASTELPLEGELKYSDDTASYVAKNIGVVSSKTGLRIITDCK